MLAVFAVVYVGSGIASFFVLAGSVGVIVGIVMIGIGLLWLRGASASAVRRQQQRQRRPD